MSLDNAKNYIKTLSEQEIEAFMEKDEDEVFEAVKKAGVDCTLDEFVEAMALAEVIEDEDFQD